MGAKIEYEQVAAGSTIGLARLDRSHSLFRVEITAPTSPDKPGYALYLTLIPWDWPRHRSNGAYVGRLKTQDKAKAFAQTIADRANDEPFDVLFGKRGDAGGADTDGAHVRANDDAPNEIPPEVDFSNGAPNPYIGRVPRRVTLSVDEDVLEHFKDEARRTGVPYQTLMARYLSECAARGRLSATD